MNCRKFVLTLNSIFKDVKVKKCKIVDDNFHARFSVKEKEYLYKINIGQYNSIFNDYVYNYNKEIDYDRLCEVKNLFVGIHNFKSFSTGSHNNYFCKINGIDIEKKENMIIIKIRGKNFLTHMVRNIVAIMILYTNKKISLNEIQDMLKGADKALDYAPAPASGLYLNKVIY